MKNANKIQDAKKQDAKRLDSNLLDSTMKGTKVQNAKKANQAVPEANLAGGDPRIESQVDRLENPADRPESRADRLESPAQGSVAAHEAVDLRGEIEAKNLAAQVEDALRSMPDLTGGDPSKPKSYLHYEGEARQSKPPLDAGKKVFSWQDFWIINLGTIILACGVYFFKYPNHFAMGGVSGIAVLLAPFVPISATTISNILNIILLAIGFMVFGKGFGARTLYASTIFTVELALLEWLVPLKGPLTSMPLLEMTYAVLLPAAGSAILFNKKASSGGTDIVAMIVQKYSSLDIGKALLVSDVLITLGSFFIFDLETALMSVMGLLTKGLIVDSVIDALNRVKAFMIITTEGKAISDYITVELDRGVTLFSARGYYSGEAKTVIITVVNSFEAVSLRDHVKTLDPHAFMLIQNTSQIIGRGFRSSF